MSIRVQPKEIEVRKDDPFQHDLLEREDFAATLTGVVDSIEGPCVLAIDATWGAGKSTFLRLWAQHLKNQGFSVLEFNAWETDYAEYPFIALSAALTEGLKEVRPEEGEGAVSKLADQASKVVLHITPSLIKYAAGAVTNGGLGEAIGGMLASYAQKRMRDHEESRRSIESFREELQGIAGELRKDSDHPLAVIIDELDRCRPSYAVEFLEVAKHLFAVDDIVFVLAVNREQLEHSVRNVYGSEIDAGEYLRRFFDVAVRLPQPDPRKFIEVLFQATNIDELIEQEDATSREDCAVAKSFLRTVFTETGLSLRRIEQEVHHLSLVLASKEYLQLGLVLAPAVMLLALKIVDREAYDQLARGEIDGSRVAGSVRAKLMPYISNDAFENCVTGLIDNLTEPPHIYRETIKVMEQLSEK